MPNCPIGWWSAVCVSCQRYTAAQHRAVAVDGHLICIHLVSSINPVKSVPFLSLSSVIVYCKLETGSAGGWDREAEWASQNWWAVAELWGWGRRQQPSIDIDDRRQGRELLGWVMAGWDEWRVWEGEAWGVFTYLFRFAHWSLIDAQIGKTRMIIICKFANDDK